MKPTLWTIIVALTLACLGDGLLFDSAEGRTADSAEARAVAGDASQIRIGLTSLRLAHR
jgi:hypothetical protein